MRSDEIDKRHLSPFSISKGREAQHAVSVWLLQRDALHWDLISTG